MKKYLFDTDVTMKPYNRKKWWIDSGVIPEFCIDAESVKEAIKIYRELTEKRCCIEISKTAVKRKSPMYIDTKEGPKQAGYVLTGSTDFWDDEEYKWSKQFVDLWVNVSVLEDADF